jgi:flagellar hook-associated protein 1
MSSIGSILNIARTAINSSQTAVQVASQNIANAATEGYSRQRAVLTPGVPEVTPYGSLGTGVIVNDVVRVRDTMLDANFRRDAGNASGYATRRDLVSGIESVLAEPSEGALASTLDAFYNAWSDLANNPTSGAAKSVVRQRGGQLATTLNSYAAGLEQQQRSTLDRLNSSIADFNQLAHQVAKLNEQVVAAELGGHSAGDLRDQRDLLVDKMAKLGTVKTIERPDGSIAVYLQNATIVDGSSVKQLQPVTQAKQLHPLVPGGPNPPAGITVEGDTTPLPVVTGAFSAMLGVLNDDIPATSAKLDRLAAGIVEQVNTIHRTGWTAAGEAKNAATAVARWSDPDPSKRGSGVDFFDPRTGPGSVNAANIRLSADVLQSVDFVAAGTSSLDASNTVRAATGNNAVALALAGLRDVSTKTTVTLDALGVPTYTASTTDAGFGGKTAASFYRDTVTDVALEVRAATNDATVYDTMAAQAESRRSSVSGVSTDEELVLLMRYQQAYAAATKLVHAVDEMAQSVLAMI